MLKIKATKVNEKVKVKLFIHSLLPKSQKEKRGQSNIDHISASVDNHIIYDASLSKHIYRNSLIKFNYRYKDNEKIINIVYTDDKGNKFHKSKAIKGALNSKELKDIKKQNLSFINYKTIKPNIWKINTVDNTVEELYGYTKSTNRKIKVCSKPYTYNNRVDININAEVLLESLIILTETETNSIIDGVFKTPIDTLINYKISLNLYTGHYNNIVIIGKGIDGKLYKTIHKVTRLGISCSGASPENEILCHY